MLWTGREFVWRDLTLDWLDRDGIAHEGLCMRWAADFRPATVVKTALMRDIEDDGLRIAEAWEDDAAIVTLLRDAGVPTVHEVGGAVS